MISFFFLPACLPACLFAFFPSISGEASVQKPFLRTLQKPLSLEDQPHASINILVNLRFYGLINPSYVLNVCPGCNQRQGMALTFNLPSETHVTNAHLLPPCGDLCVNLIWLRGAAAGRTLFLSVSRKD